MYRPEPRRDDHHRADNVRGPRDQAVGRRKMVADQVDDEADLQRVEDRRDSGTLAKRDPQQQEQEAGDLDDPTQRQAHTAGTPWWNTSHGARPRCAVTNMLMPRAKKRQPEDAPRQTLGRSIGEACRATRPDLIDGRVHPPGSDGTMFFSKRCAACGCVGERVLCHRCRTRFLGSTGPKSSRHRGRVLVRGSAQGLDRRLEVPAPSSRTATVLAGDIFVGDVIAAPVMFEKSAGARGSSDAVTKILTRASGQTTVPMSRPSRTAPLPCCANVR